MTDGILFCTPCYGGMVTTAHFQSCLNLKEELSRVDLKHDWLLGTNESLIHRGRNEMAHSFLLQTDFSHMMWLDADIEFEPHHVAALWNMDVDVAVGCYAMKKPGEDWFAAWVDGKLVKDLDQFDGPVKVDYAGTGFMMIKREAYMRIKNNGINSYEKEGQDVGVYYDTPVHDGVFESEDYNFCRKVRECGMEVVMDPSIRLKHIGQFAYGS